MPDNTKDVDPPMHRCHGQRHSHIMRRLRPARAAWFAFGVYISRSRCGIHTFIQTKAKCVPQRAVLWLVLHRLGLVANNLHDLSINRSILLRFSIALVMPRAMAEDQEKVKMDVSNLGVLWETEQAIRDHLRSTADGDLQVLFKEKTKETVKDACVPHVHALLKIALQKTVETDGMPPPPIHPLREQLEQLYQRCGRTGIGEDQIVADSWWVRKFIGLVKMKVRKRKVSEVPSLI